MISDTYLALFLAQLQQEGIVKLTYIYRMFRCCDSEKIIKGSVCAGYSIFVIGGNLPECEAEQILGFMRVQQQQRPRLIGEEEAQTSAGYVIYVQTLQYGAPRINPERSILSVSKFHVVKNKLVT